MYILVGFIAIIVGCTLEWVGFNMVYCITFDSQLDTISNQILGLWITIFGLTFIITGLSALNFAVMNLLLKTLHGIDK